MKPEKTRNGGQWTEARFNGFIKSLLRNGSNRWGPKFAARKAARIAHNTYVCASCKKTFGTRDVVVDHINPVVSINPIDNTWDMIISRMFCEVDGYQVLCNCGNDSCHKIKTDWERVARRAEKKKLK